jgi:hypothetical protein
MSDTSMNTPTSHTRSGGTKVAKPDLFHGDRLKLEDWLLQFDLFFKFEEDHVDADDRASLMASYMRGAALKWVQPYLKKYMDDNNDDDEITNMFDDHQAFKTKLRQNFAVANEPLVAERKIQVLRQKNAAGDYANVFQQYAVQTDWDDKALMRMYKQGLKDSVKAELMRSGAQVNTLDQLINESVRLDNELYELALETRAEKTFDTAKKRKTFTPNSGKPRGRRFQPRTPGHYTSSNGYEEMHVDNLEKGRFNPKDSGKKETRSCYNCGKAGHLSRDCRQKNKVTRQINMLTGPTDDTEEEWDIVSPLFKLDIDEGYNILPVRNRLESPLSDNDEPLIVRSPTPHPGTRIPTVWDDEGSDKENEDPAMDRALTPAELAIHTPPASPKLVRQNATIGQDKDWVTQAEEEYRKRLRNQVEESTNAPLRRKPRTINYLLDHRNQDHGLVAWSFCTYDYCSIHYDSKISNGWFPEPKPTCKWQAFDCPKDVCARHLWDKRNSGQFPGTTDQDRISQRLLINGSCLHYTWQFCMQTECQKHKDDKESNGYGERPFLGQRSAPRAATL